MLQLPHVEQCLVTVHYVRPTLENIVENIKDVGVYTTLDLRWGFLQVCIVESDIPKTAFWALMACMSKLWAV